MAFERFWNRLAAFDKTVRDELRPYLADSDCERLVVDAFFQEPGKYHYYGFIRSPAATFREIIRAHGSANARWNSSTVACHHFQHSNSSDPVAGSSRNVSADPKCAEGIFDGTLRHGTMVFLSIPAGWPAGKLVSVACVSYPDPTFEALLNSNSQNAILGAIRTSLGPSALTNGDIPDGQSRPWHDPVVSELNAQTLSPFGLVGRSNVMADMRRFASEAANSWATVLLTGKTGCGKTQLARAIHNMGETRSHKLVEKHLPAIPADLIESELFGHVRGSFTGAIADRDGACMTAAGGTLFLDEIGDLNQYLQVKLLKLTGDGKFNPLGSEEDKGFTGRLIFATNKPIVEMVRDKTFREDLYYRINKLPYTVPPLKDHSEDIGEIAMSLLADVLDDPRSHCSYKNYRSGFSIAAIAALRVAAARDQINPRVIQGKIEKALARQAAPGSIINPEDLELPSDGETEPVQRNYEDRDRACGGHGECRLLAVKHNEDAVLCENFRFVNRRFPNETQEGHAKRLGITSKALQDRFKNYPEWKAIPDTELGRAWRNRRSRANKGE